MTNYLPALIWILGAVVAYCIARRRGVKVTLMWEIVALVLGPFTIPLALIVKPQRPADSNPVRG